jgi:hypothetical protein
MTNKSKTHQYYYETKGGSSGWIKADTDQQAILKTKGFGSIHMWRVEQSGKRTLVLKRKGKRR